MLDYTLLNEPTKLLERLAELEAQLEAADTEIDRLIRECYATYSKDDLEAQLAEITERSAGYVVRKDRDCTVLETCEIFRVTPPTIYRMLNEGKLKGYTIGRSRRITHESIQAMREAR